ncbi:pentapeptide repeat-containing protein [Octadecabacter sp.]|nr:pentapeptide repeat-containing protein [Octadecabacter sp.]
MDPVELTPANTNPWYVLMTLEGEQNGEDVDRELAKRNSKLWNAWICQEMSKDERSSFPLAFDIGRPESDWNPVLAEKIKSLFQKRYRHLKELPEMPHPSDPIDLSYTEFSRPLVLEFGLFREISFDGSVFCGAFDISNSIFDGYTSFISGWFRGTAYIRGGKFRKVVRFGKASFSRSANFDDCDFDKRAHFNNIETEGAISFVDAKFRGDAEFIGSNFDGTVNFLEAQFLSGSSFRHAKFKRSTSLHDVMFVERSNFSGAHFGGNTSFDGASFKADADFQKITADGLVTFKGKSKLFSTRPPAHFGTKTLFSESHFKGRVDFYQRRFGPYDEPAAAVTFANAILEQPVSFEDATFPHVMPVSSNTTLPASTKVTAEDSHWPKLPSPFNWITGRTSFRKHQDHAKVKEAAGALRHAMARQMLPEEEHFFFRREMFAGARCGPWFQGLITRLFFELPSNYGYSIERPAALLGVVWAIGALLYWCFADFTKGAAASYSFSAMFKFFGFQRTFFWPETQALAPAMQTVAATQTVLAFILLFFLGLGLRTRFRLR